MEIQTSANLAVLKLRARQLCYLGGHAPESGEIIGILQKLKDGMPTDPADSQNEIEASNANHAGPTAAKKQEIATVRIETNLRQGDLGVEVDTVEGDLAETENSLAGDEAPSEWEERKKGHSRRTQQTVAEEVISTVDEEVWLACGSAGNSTGGRAHSPTAMLCSVLQNSLMSALLVAETRKSRRKVSGVRPS